MPAVLAKMSSRSASWFYAFSVFVLSICGSTHAANNCNGPLLSVLPESSFKSSSTSSNSQLPHFVKLNRREGEGGWAPERSDRQPWLQLDLREKMEVTAIATQGRSGSSDWVNSYMLLFSDCGLVWKQYGQSEDTGTFTGNTNSEGVVQHKLVHSVTARFLRFVPLDWSTTGWIGLRVEVYGCVYKSDVADFNGRSALLYRFNQKSQSTVKDVISLRFKSNGADGVLVHGEGHRGDYLTLELHHGTLALHLNLDDAKLYPSSGNVSVGLGSLLDDQLWHSVLVKRSNKQVNLTVDGHTCHLSTTGVDDSLEVDYELSFGGIPIPGKPGSFLRKNFHGCIENLYYNGINIINLAKRRKLQIHSVGNVTFSCSETQPQMVSTTFLSSSSSYLSLPLEPPGVWGLDVHFHFRTWNQEGLLFSTGLAQHLVLHISRGQLHLMVHGAAEQKTNISIDVSVTDGLWHSVSLSYRDLKVSLVLDNEPASTMDVQSHADSGNSVFFGGCPQHSGGCKNPTVAFQGCMRQILLNNKLMDLPRVQQGLLGNYSKLEFDICGIRNRCLPNFCEHDGRCTQSWETFYCDCSGTGYTGETCHNSIYEASCEAHRQMGSTSGNFYIDPDGSGPLKATLVYCNMTEDKVWTVVGHNNSGSVNVTGATTKKPYVMRFNYTASLEQLRTLIGRSEQCQQEVVYSCRKSRLFNTWDGRPLSWWLDRSGEKQTYWGGSVPGVQQCSCSLEENCIDMNYFCNCDADTNLWVNDTGLLSYKDHLPLTEIVIGDTNRTGSAAVYRVSFLHCNGDRFLWNAASFYPGSSSLHFPKFQAELSADISLYFKTTASSGVLLENMGTTDFITLKLTSTSAVTFSFDVGNGPVDLTVTSPVPLNDKQWHYVRAERNLKEASLQVDQLPLHTLEAPSEGHYRLQLKSLLFIGGSTFRESSFLGCIRALTLNGVTLDLEERAKLTPGVTPGCPGHCSGSASICHNRGRCMEKNSGYVCDCTHSAYNGPHCKKAVSMSFESGSSVTLTFQMPFPVIHNRDRGSQSSSSQPVHSQSSAIYAHNIEFRENVAFSFLTTHTPAMLLCVSTYHQQYLAIILANNGSLQIWYRLNREKRAEIFTPKASSLADGQLHRVQVHREGKDLYVQIDKDIDQKYNLSSDTKMNTLRTVTLGKVTGTSAGLAGLDEEVLRAGSKGFIGCLSSVQFNHLTPLKTAILNHGSSLVRVLGNLVESNCGALAATSQSASEGGDSDVDRLKKTRSDSAVIGGLITAVFLITLCAMAVTSWFLYRRCSRTHPQEKASISQKKDPRHSLEHSYPVDLVLDLDLDLHSSVRHNRKEYYI
ncbi:contactin-associated protein-like 5 [Coregonus clupeaformis]|uniref:contactin-associated protein-like 5 n=1 Tax=Coregonus clupeaformis TaxID=59861 RepID=UPI001E1C7DB3|nr:contactin-associated protein-like 5 [Coregonus clupeaformis]